MTHDKEVSTVTCVTGLNQNRLRDECLVMTFCAAFAAALFTFILTIRGLSPIDDHWFLVSLFQGKHFDAFINRALGRFYPFVGQEYALAAAIFSPSSWLFHLIEAVKMFVAAGLLLSCLLLTQARPLVVAVIWSSTFFSIGFTDASVRLLVGELNEFILILILVAALLVRQRTPRLVKKQSIFTIVGIVSLFAAFFYKEVMFIVALTLGVTELHRHLTENRGKPPSHIVAMIVGGMTYLVFYLVWHGIGLQGSYVTIHTAGMLDVIRAFAVNDPVIVFIVFPVTFVRIVAIILGRSRQSIFDSLLVAACAYASAFVMLKMYATYYFLPAYGLGMCGVAGTLRVITSRAAKGLIVSATFVLTMNNVPVAYSDMQSVKQIANNYQAFIKTISGWIWMHPTEDGRPRNVVLMGASYGRLYEQIVSLDRFLRYTGLASNAFSVRVTGPSNKEFVSVYNIKNAVPYEPRVGDLVVFTPFQDVMSLPPLLSPSYLDVFRSIENRVLPRWTVSDWFDNFTYGEGFSRRLVGNSPYVGYVAMQMVRKPSNVNSILTVNRPAYRVGPIALPERMPAGDAVWIDVMIQNIGTEVWPSTSTASSDHVVHLSYVWLDQNGRVALEGDRFDFPQSMRPGDIAAVSMNIKTPTRSGRYKLIISPVQEHVKWFYSDATQKMTDGRDIDIYRTLATRVLDRLGIP